MSDSASNRSVETSMNPRTFRFEIADGVATVTLDRAETLTALTLDTYRELRDVFVSLQDDPLAPAPVAERAGSVRAVILTGAGAGFCSGADIDQLLGQLTRMRTADILA